MPCALGAFFMIYPYNLSMHYKWDMLNVRRSYDFGQMFQLQMRWIASNVKPGEKVLVGSVFSGRLFYFKGQARANIMTWPKLNSMGEMVDYIRKNRVRYGILDLATVVHNRTVFGDYFAFGPRIGLRPKKPLPEIFRHIPKGSGAPPLFELYAFQS